MEEQEITFKSGESNGGVVRIGNTVRRNLTERSDFVHQLMEELTSHHFLLSPKFIGIDEKGREVISYISGIQMNHGEITIDIMKQSMSALKKFHDILAESKLSEDQETVVHTDFAPWNLIVEDENLVGVIDFDGAIPGKRLTDIAYVCWNFLDIGEDDGKFTDEEIFLLLPQLIAAYGDINTDNLVNELISEQSRILEKRKNRVKEAIGDQEKAERQRICDEIEESIKWVEGNEERLSKILDN